MLTEKKLVPYIGWEIQLTCNMGCAFCYSSSYNRFRRAETRDRLSTSQILAGLDTLRESELGFEFINWTGGEALLQHKQLPTIFSKSHDLGLKNILSTNCMFSAIPGLGNSRDRVASNKKFSLYLSALEPFLDWIAVSWDSADPHINNDVMRLRPDGNGGSTLHYDDVQAFIDIYRLKQFSFGLKINTLVTAKNCGPGVLDIGESLHGLRCIWKLIQFNPRECPPDERKEYEINLEVFQQAVTTARERYQFQPRFGEVKIVDRTYSGSNEPHCVLVINTSGQVLLPKGEEHVPVAALFDSNGRCCSASELRDSVLENLDREMEGSEVFRMYREQGISPMQVFSNYNRGMLLKSYPDGGHPRTGLPQLHSLGEDMVGVHSSCVRQRSSGAPCIR